MIKLTTPEGYKIETSTKEDALEILRELQQTHVEIYIDDTHDNCPQCGSDNIEPTINNTEYICRMCGSLYY